MFIGLFQKNRQCFIMQAQKIQRGSQTTPILCGRHIKGFPIVYLGIFPSSFFLRPMTYAIPKKIRIRQTFFYKILNCLSKLVEIDFCLTIIHVDIPYAK